MEDLEHKFIEYDCFMADEIIHDPNEVIPIVRVSGAASTA